MPRSWLVAVVLALTVPVLADAPVAAPPAPPHGKARASGDHPRLLFSSGELESLRRKVNAQGTLSNFLWAHARDAAPTSAGVPDFWAALHAFAPAAALLSESEEDRRRWARVAADSALAIVRTFDPPYPDQEEWWGRYLYRYLALAYDAAYGAMTAEEREELREEMQRICALISGTERSTNNHSLVFGIDGGLLATALDGEVAPDPRTYSDEPVKRGETFPGGDWVKFRSSIVVARIGTKPGAADFAPGKDYVVKWFRDPGAPQQSGFGIEWAKGGRAPAVGDTYYVTYTFTPDVAGWKDSAFATVERNLDGVWGDGASLAGVMYGGWTLNWLLDAFEAMRRDTGVDFANHPSVRDFPRWLATELIATDKPFLRCNNRNDSKYDQMDERVRFGPCLAWASTHFRGDPGRRDVAAAWLQARSTAWIEWSDWREAVWVRDDLQGPPPFKPVGRLDLPLSAFFRGHDLSNFRTGDWDGPPDDWALFAIVGGPFAGPEHDQTDKGSFTFYACGEDWAIDSGYAQGDVKSDATAAHNYVLIDGKGQPGPWGTTASVRGHFLGAAFDATHVDLRRSWLNAQGWGAPKDEKPQMWPVQAADRYGVLLKRAGRAPVAVVADAIDKDGKPHAFEWLLHTQAGNTIAIDGAAATIAGANGKGSCALRLASSAPLTLRTDTAAGTDFPVHPRLVATANAPALHVLALLVPEKRGETSPLDARTETGPGWVGATVKGGGAADIVVSTGTGAIVKALGVETDAAFAVIRVGVDGVPTAWLVFDATSLKASGRTLFAVDRAKGARGSASWDGSSLSVEPGELRQFRAFAPGAKGFARGDVTLPGVAAGDVLSWSGKRPLRDAYPDGVPALAEDFDGGLAPYFIQFPLAKPRFVRVVDGELCLPGLKHDWVSWTRRTYTPFRADVISWPRTIYEDCVLRGEVTFVDWRPGATWKVEAHVADRTYPEDWQPPDQNFLEVELDPATGTATLSQRLDGKRSPLATAKVGAIAKGRKTPFELSIEGTTVRFSWAGAAKLAVHREGREPPVVGVLPVGADRGAPRAPRRPEGLRRTVGRGRADAIVADAKGRRGPRPRSCLIGVRSRASRLRRVRRRSSVRDLPLPISGERPRRLGRAPGSARTSASPPRRRPSARLRRR